MKIRKSQYKFSIQEYTALRNEINIRIQNINHHVSTALVAVISAWAAGLTFEIKLLSDPLTCRYIYEELAIYFLRALLFAIPVFFFVPLAVKCGENLTQTESIAAYLRVFYEYPLKEEKENMHWEICNNLLSDTNVGKKKKRNRLIYAYNGEYIILAMISFAMCILLSIMDVMRINDLYQNREINCCIMLIFIVVYIALIGLMLCSLVAIYKASSLKKTFMDHEKYYTNGYLSIARELDVLSEEQVKEAAKQLAPERTIDFREYI